MTKKRGKGRPTKYTQALADEICRRLADGETLLAICKDAHMPAESVVRGWASDTAREFSARYTRAREVGYQRMADEIT